MSGVLRVGPVSVVVVLVGVIWLPPVAARDVHELACIQSLESRWFASPIERPAEDGVFQAPMPLEGRSDLRWIARLNAHSADRRGQLGDMLPLLSGLGSGQRWRPAVRNRVPADFEPQEALLLPAGLLADEDPEVLTGFVAAARGRTAVMAIVANPAQRERVQQSLRKAGLPTAGIHFAEMPHNTKWVRDYGPIFVRLQNSRRLAVDTEYPESGREDDDAIPARLAGRFHAGLLPAPIIFEGGNLLSNGHGLCVTTTAAVFRNSDKPEAEARVCNVFRDCFGSTQTVFLEPLMGEPTGHVDMFACFTAPDVVVLGAYDPAVDPLNAALLDRNAARLIGLATPRGPLRVVRIPMPPRSDGNWRTYTNVVFANSVVLVPTYRGVDRLGREKALETFTRLLPGWHVIDVDCTNLIQGGGALRCVSAGVPLGPRQAAAPLRAR